MDGVYLLAPSIHRNLEHFIPGAGSLGDLKQLGHERRPLPEHQPLSYHRDIPDQPGSREDTHAERFVEAARYHWRLDWLGNRPFPNATLLTARLPVRLDHVGLGFSGSDIFIHLRQDIHDRHRGGLDAAPDLDGGV